MIIVRYLTRQVVSASLAVAVVLLVTVMVGRFLKYLASAAEGKLDPSVLALLMAYRMPEFVQLILPLSLLMGILLAYGRMYAESEMTVLVACGLSRRRLLALTMGPALLFTLLVGLLALRVTPMGLVNTETLLGAQEELTEFDVLVPGLFQNISRGERTTYAERVEGGQLYNVFMYERETDRVTVAASAVASQDEDGNRFILLRDGSLSQGLAGENEYTLTRFDELGLRMPGRDLEFEVSVEEKALPTSRLLGSGDPAHAAELQWRLSLVVLIPILTLIAVPLSRVSPRQGRFARLVPAIGIFILYFGLLMACRDQVEAGRLTPAIGLWWVHLAFLGLGLLLFLDKVPDPRVLLSRPRLPRPGRRRE